MLKKWTHLVEDHQEKKKNYMMILFMFVLDDEIMKKSLEFEHVKTLFYHSVYTLIMPFAFLIEVFVCGNVRSRFVSFRFLESSLFLNINILWLFFRFFFFKSQCIYFFSLLYRKAENRKSKLNGWHFQAFQLDIMSRLKTKFFYFAPI